jgi:hypothetical protein
MRYRLAAAFALVVAAAATRPASSAPRAFGGGADRGSPPAEGERGFLDIVSDPPAKILVDGADTGKTTPQHRLELPVGHHKLTLITLSGAHQRSVGFTIDRGQTTQLAFHLAS